MEDKLHNNKTYFIKKLPLHQSTLIRSLRFDFSVQALSNKTFLDFCVAQLRYY